MSERLERWKAAEEIRSHLGWFAILIGISGVSGILMGFVALGLSIAGIDGGKLRISGVELPQAFAPLFLFLLGASLFACARGLWNGRAWARWTMVALCALSLAGQTLEYARDGELALPLALFVLVYLLLPATGRRFARAQGSPPAEPSPARPRG